jgi:hypothetical protein
MDGDEAYADYARTGWELDQNEKARDWLADHGYFDWQEKKEQEKYLENYYDRMNSKSLGGNFCFITTAVCQTLKKPDDCEELKKFRRFRDTFMQETAEMRAEVQEYYDIAPQICAAIDSTGEKAATARYAAIWETSLKPAFTALETGDRQKAYDLYKDMVLDLKQELLCGDSHEQI